MGFLALTRGLIFLCYTVAIIEIQLTFECSSTKEAEFRSGTITVATIACDNAEGGSNLVSVSASRSTCPTISSNHCKALIEFDQQQAQVLTLLKSLLITWVHDSTAGSIECITQPRFLEFIIFSNNYSRFNEISTQVQKWSPKYTHFLNLKFKEVMYPPEHGWMKQKYLPCSSYRAYFPQALAEMDPTLQRAIYLDNDILVFRDVRSLWKLFDEFSDNMLIGATSKHEDYWLVEDLYSAIAQRTPRIAMEKHRIGVNPGVLLVNLTNWKKSDNWLKWMERTGLQEELKAARFMDQALISAFLSKSNKNLYRLSPSWNFVSGCFNGQFKTTHAACSPPEDGISLLHGEYGSFVKKPSVEPSILLRIFDHFNEADLSSTTSFSPEIFVRKLHSNLKLKGQRSNSKELSYLFSEPALLLKMIFKYLKNLK